MYVFKNEYSMKCLIFFKTLKELSKKIYEIDCNRNLLVLVKLNVVNLFVAPLLLNVKSCFSESKISKISKYDECTKYSFIIKNDLYPLKNKMLN